MYLYDLLTSGTFKDIQINKPQRQAWKYASNTSYGCASFLRHIKIVLFCTSIEIKYFLSRKSFNESSVSLVKIKSFFIRAARETPIFILNPHMFIAAKKNY